VATGGWLGVIRSTILSYYFGIVLLRNRILRSVEDEQIAPELHDYSNEWPVP